MTIGLEIGALQRLLLLRTVLTTVRISSLSIEMEDEIKVQKMVVMTASWR
jgi:hypothetical protein